MKHSLLAAALLLAAMFLAPMAQADSIDNFSGVIKQPGEKITYTFTVNTLDEPSYVLDILNGQVIWQQGSIGCHPCTETITDNFYIFGYNETIDLLDITPNLYILGTPTGAFLVDPPAHTPEPATIIYLAAAASFILIFMPRKHKEFRS